MSVVRFKRFRGIRSDNEEQVAEIETHFMGETGVKGVQHPGGSIRRYDSKIDNLSVNPLVIEYSFYCAVIAGGKP